MEKDKDEDIVAQKLGKLELSPEEEAKQFEADKKAFEGTRDGVVRRNPPRAAKEKAALTVEDGAAQKIQSAFRGMKGREEAKEFRLWKAWTALDQKEESELVHTHEHYEEMKEKYKRLKSLPQIQGAKPTQLDDDKVPRVPEVINLDFVTAVMDHFKHNKALKRQDVETILKRVEPLLAKHPNVVQVPIHTRITVVGDLHGQLDDLFTIFKLNGMPSLRNSYLFNGDFVDRGQFSLEVVLVLFLFKILFPENMFLNRGNHEAKDINSRDGFEKECLLKYDSKIFDMFAHVFACLPIAHVLQEKIFVVHGGLTWNDITIEDINKENRFHEMPEQDSIIEQLLWSDPQEKKGRADNPRGASLVFGPDVVKTFLKTNKLALIVRSHECKRQGFESMFKDTLMTVFSASNYCGVVGNKGAFVVFEKSLEYQAVQYEAKPKEKMARHRMKHTSIENDVISKLLRRIAESRLALTDWYMKKDKDKKNIISRATWAEGLKQVLGLDIPFLEFQGYLGLPKLGVDGQDHGAVDYMSFLDRFRIQLALPSQSEKKSDLPEESKKALEVIGAMLLKNRYELESLFRYFDANGDGEISLPEFRDGLLSLRPLLGHDMNEKHIEALVDFVDKNHDGAIQYEEFFDSFVVADPRLAELQKRGAEQKKERKKMPV